MFSVNEILDLAIQIEENGEHFYRQATTRCSDQSLLDTLLCFAEEEKCHREFFIKLKSSLNDDSNRNLAEQLSGAMLKGALADRLFSMDEVDMNSIPDVNALVEVAISLEQDTVMFYEIIASFVTEPKTLRQLEGIITEERKHIESFRERQESSGDVEDGRTAKN